MTLQHLETKFRIKYWQLLNQETGYFKYSRQAMTTFLLSWHTFLAKHTAVFKFNVDSKCAARKVYRPFDFAIVICL
ncbi:MAG: hypothetical protein CV080_02045 [Candidatus Kuenenia stuttgartiensis]|uniref:Uncharacterized protein n=1 Tax=Kuenenia stuttgartiensis TaxID=174633 RepID=Q1PVC7_KUEST|nr:MAG: hypothetical protein CV080_02045 [Candidatus Kuenenia stuttgartiensis]CAJ71179.1 unknown protein [Candidatus Kuenenia stuttgartiensis]